MVVRLALLALLLAGCAERWERPGASEADADAAQQACSAVATAQVPPALVWAQTAAGYWQPAERRCRTRNGVTDCIYRPARYYPPQYGWVDANTGLRSAARAACLREGGWTYQGLRPVRLW